MPSGIRLGGLASGMDTETIVTQLMAIERQPRGRLERKQAAAQARQDALRDISTKLKTLKTAAQSLAAAGTWTRTQSLTSTDPTRVGARVAGSVVPGTYDIEVTQLAADASRTLNLQPRPNPSSLDSTPAATGTPYSVAIPPNSSVDAIVALVNGDAAAPVVARNYNGQLLLSAKAAGAGGNFTASGQVVASQAAAVTGTDAQFKVNGAAYTRTTNAVADAIPGVELSLNGLTTAGTPVQLTVGEPTVDAKALAGKVKAFVDAYNAVVDATRSRTTEKRVANPTTLADAKKGVLFGDNGLNSMLSKLRVAVMEPAAVGNLGSIDEFSEIGVSTGAPTGSTSTPDSLSGKLQFSEAKFLDAFAADPGSVERLLRGTASATGLSTRLDEVIRPFTEVNGMFDGRLTASTSELTRLGEQLKRMDERLGRKETFLRRQFTALEGALTKLNAQSTEISTKLPGASND
jgi:flagellar hook-associated protein 2